MTNIGNKTKKIAGFTQNIKLLRQQLQEQKKKIEDLNNEIDAYKEAQAAAAAFVEDGK